MYHTETVPCTQVGRSHTRWKHKVVSAFILLPSTGFSTVAIMSRSCSSLLAHKRPTWPCIVRMLRQDAIK